MRFYLYVIFRFRDKNLIFIFRGISNETSLFLGVLRSCAGTNKKKRGGGGRTKARSPFSRIGIAANATSNKTAKENAQAVLFYLPG